VRILVISLLGVILVALGLWIRGATDLAYWVGQLGTLGVLALVLAYVVGIDSRRRWPGTTWIARLGKVFFFER
jgi:uncharacterized protein (DUF983 family)